MSRRERDIEGLAAHLRALLIERHRAAVQAGGGTVASSPAAAIEAALSELVADEAALLSETTREELRDRVLRDTLGLGPLEVLLADPGVEEVMVNGHEEVWIERRGRLELTEAAFGSEQELRDVIERILGPLGRRVDELQPFADGRLADGSRVNVIIPPLAVDGPALSIRRFGIERPGPGELERSGSIPAEAMAILRAAVIERRNILISGGTGSGKTTVLNALSGFIPAGERVITIEDAAELRLRQPHVVRLESRPPSVEGAGAISIRELVRNALRMRPDRIVIGEVRGAEAVDLVAALNTGHRGSLSTVHANSPAHALRRLETLALMSELRLPHAVLREQIASAVDLVLHLERGRDGARRAASLAEVSWVAGSAATRELWSRTDG